MSIQPHPSLAVSIAAVRELIEHSLKSQAVAHERRAHDTRAQALELALEGLSVLWQALEAQRQEFARERERFMEFFECAPEACLVTDVSGGILHANAAAAELLQLSPEALSRKSLTAFVAKDRRSAFRCHLAALGVQSEAREPKRWRSAVRNGDADRIEVEVSVRCVRRPSGPTVLCWLLRRAP